MPSQSTSLAKLFDGALDRVPVIGILRGYPADAARQAADVAAAGGIKVVEVTLDSPDARQSIAAIAESETDLFVGAGTVTSPEQVPDVLAAGAQFVVTPGLVDRVVEACVEAGVPVIPGAATPTEVLRALSLGATAVKVFPAEQLGGPTYLRAIRAPLRNPPLIPTGGIGPENAAEYLAGGAAALGAGSSLFPARIAEESDWDSLADLVARWVEVVR